jgi:hypothetical protein
MTEDELILYEGKSIRYGVEPLVRAEFREFVCQRNPPWRAARYLSMLPISFII